MLLSRVLGILLTLSLFAQGFAAQTPSPIKHMPTSLDTYLAHVLKNPLSLDDVTLAIAVINAKAKETSQIKVNWDEFFLGLEVREWQSIHSNISAHQFAGADIKIQKAMNTFLKDRNAIYMQWIKVLHWVKLQRDADGSALEGGLEKLKEIEADCAKAVKTDWDYLEGLKENIDQLHKDLVGSGDGFFGICAPVCAGGLCCRPCPKVSKVVCNAICFACDATVTRSCDCCLATQRYAANATTSANHSSVAQEAAFKKAIEAFQFEIEQARIAAHGLNNHLFDAFGFKTSGSQDSSQSPIVGPWSDLWTTVELEPEGEYQDDKLVAAIALWESFAREFVTRQETYVKVLGDLKSKRFGSPRKEGDMARVNSQALSVSVRSFREHGQSFREEETH